MVRRYGLIREMGAGRRDRIKPWRTPISALEILWYRGLVARAFANTASGPSEFIFIPSDLLPFLPPPDSSIDPGLGVKAKNPKRIELGSSAAIEDATTILASLRREPSKLKILEPTQQEALTPFLHQPQSLDLILELLGDLGLLESSPVQPQLETTRDFLEIPRENAYARLLLSWRDSNTWNDLMHVGGLHFAGAKWPNDPLISRYNVLNLLRLLPSGQWWGLESFIQAIHKQHPSYLRPAGDFDSWYLQDSETGDFLHGYEHWEKIDGALLRYIITHPMHFLGASDLGAAGPDHPPSAFRLTSNSRILFDPDFVSQQGENGKSISIFLDGTILAPLGCLQSHRYQIARFCDWLELNPSGFRYRISPLALQKATEQGLSLAQVKSILERASEGILPPSLLEAFTRWESKGRESFVEKIVVLRVKEPRLMDKLQSNYATARFLQEKLGPTAVVVQEKDLEKLYAAAVQIGILIDPPKKPS
jgi:hypothetical protein